MHDIEARCAHVERTWQQHPRPIGEHQLYVNRSRAWQGWYAHPQTMPVYHDRVGGYAVDHYDHRAVSIKVPDQAQLGPGLHDTILRQRELRWSTPAGAHHS